MTRISSKLPRFITRVGVTALTALTVFVVAALILSRTDLASAPAPRVASFDPVKDEKAAKPEDEDEGEGEDDNRGGGNGGGNGNGPTDDPSDGTADTTEGGGYGEPPAETSDTRGAKDTNNSRNNE